MSQEESGLYRMGEIWRPVFGYEGLYEISSLCRIKRLARKGSYSRLGRRVNFNVTEKILSVMGNNRRYKTICLTKDGVEKTLDLHRLIAKAFVKGYFKGAHVNHIDGDTHNNKIENLEWTTCSKNLKHSYQVLGRITPSRKLTENQVLEIRSLAKIGEKHKNIAKEFNISTGYVEAISNRRSWAWLK